MKSLTACCGLLRGLLWAQGVLGRLHGILTGLLRVLFRSTATRGAAAAASSGHGLLYGAVACPRSAGPHGLCWVRDDEMPACVPSVSRAQLQDTDTPSKTMFCSWTRPLSGPEGPCTVCVTLVRTKNRQRRPQLELFAFNFCG